MQKEMDGCLPLEKVPANPKQWFFAEKEMLKLNSGRSAIYAAIQDYERHGRKIKKVFVPLYLCGTVRDYLVQRGVNVEEYNLRDDFVPCVPDSFCLAETEMLLWPNYFGCMPAALIDRMAERFKNQLIIDNTQAFFSKPREKCYNVYSCRKFIGVAEGAYLIHKDFALRQEDIPPAVLHMDMWLAPCCSAQTGANSAYGYYLKNGRYWSEEYCAMSLLTETVLHGVDYYVIQDKRRENFQTLHRLLREYNHISGIDFDTETAYYYPFVVENAVLREYLHQNNIYTSMWWKSVVSDKRATKAESSLALYLYPLVIDQRYDTNDMKDLANLIISFLERENRDEQRSI